jgi:hypothetical protein
MIELNQAWIEQYLGYGSLHISNQTFNAMLQLAIEQKYNTSNRFGDGLTGVCG